MSASISSPVPSGLLVPLFYASFDNSQAGYGQAPFRVLMIGQSLNAVPNTPTYVAGYSDAATLFGPGSTLARQVEAWRANESLVEIHALPYADASGATAASGSLAFTGAATESYPIVLSAGHDDPAISYGAPLTIGITNGDTAAVIAGKVAAAVTASPKSLVSAAADSGASTTTMTAKNAGTGGNSIGLAVNRQGIKAGQRLPAGVGLTITQMSGGAGDPDISNLAAVLGNDPYQIIINPYSTLTGLTQTTALMNDTTGRWSYAQQNYGHVFSAMSVQSAGGTSAASALQSFAGAGALNDQHLTLFGLPDSLTSGPIAAAIYAASVAGGVSVAPAQPVQTLPLSGLVPPAPGMSLDMPTQNALLSNGVALANFATDGSASICRAVTTYQQNRFGSPDRSYLDCETMFTLAEITNRLRTIVTQKFPRANLAPDGTKAGPFVPIVTPSSFKAEITAAYEQMEYDGLVASADLMTAATVVQTDPSNPGRLAVLWAPYLLPGFRIADVVNQFRFAA